MDFRPRHVFNDCQTNMFFAYLNTYFAYRFRKRTTQLFPGPNSIGQSMFEHWTLSRWSERITRLRDLRFLRSSYLQPPQPDIPNFRMHIYVHNNPKCFDPPPQFTQTFGFRFARKRQRLCMAVRYAHHIYLWQKQRAEFRFGKAKFSVDRWIAGARFERLFTCCSRWMRVIGRVITIYKFGFLVRLPKKIWFSFADESQSVLVLCPNT